jgi:hypothetical protein
MSIFVLRFYSNLQTVTGGAVVCENISDTVRVKQELLSSQNE